MASSPHVDVRDPNAPSLMSIPLEMRHMIFDYAATKGPDPNKAIRYWFEKKDVSEQVDKIHRDNPNGPRPVMLFRWEDEYELGNESDWEEHSADLGEDEEEDPNTDDEELDDDENIDGEEELDEDEEPDDDEELDDEEELEPPGEPDDEDVDLDHEDGDDYHQAAAPFSIPYAPVPTAVSNLPGNQYGGANLNSHEEEDEEQDDVHDEEDDAERMYIRPHRKWVHIPKLIRINRRAPPLELLLVSKHLGKEAVEWFYDMAVLRINATGSFAHTSMFEEALIQISEATFSPMQNIRKVQVRFVWDSEWIRGTEGVFSEPFEAMLRLRAMHVVSALQTAPNLQEIHIDWYDSIQDGESAVLKLDVLEMFDCLLANIKVEEHYLEPGKKPKRRSILGRRRLEFQAIVDGGMNLM